MTVCCTSALVDRFPCQKPCEVVRLNCSDLFSMIIQAILDLAQPTGSTAEAITAQAAILCPTDPPTLAEVERSLTLGARRGLFRRLIATVGATPTYMVLARMGLFNPLNAPYQRFPCQFNNFWNC